LFLELRNPENPQLQLQVLLFKGLFNPERAN
jgi:hypothetical protein